MNSSHQSINQRMDEIFKACNWLWSIWNVSLLHTYCKKGGVKWHQWEFSKGFFVTELVNLTHRHSDTIKNPAGEENRHNHRATDQCVPEESGEEEKGGMVNKAMDDVDHFSHFCVYLMFDWLKWLKWNYLISLTAIRLHPWSSTLLSQEISILLCDVNFHFPWLIMSTFTSTFQEPITLLLCHPVQLSEKKMDSYELIGRRESQVWQSYWHKIP